MPEENDNEKSPASHLDGKWTLEDLAYFEAMKAKDGDQTWEELEKRDREIGRRIPQTSWKVSTNRSVIKFWLSNVASTRANAAGPLESASILDAYSLSIKIVSLIALLSGGSIALELLAYQGKQPINVSTFFGLLVLLQAGMALITLALFILPASSAKHLHASLGFQIMKPIISGASKLIYHFATRSMTGQQRETALSHYGRIQSGLSLYGPVLRWKIFGALQGIAVAFNIGAIIATLSVVSLSDRAFGWQSTLDLEANSVHSIAKLFATPWSWQWGEGVGFPSLSDIEGSRIVLKDGIQSLNSEHLVSWWPFLLFGIVVYGMAPRLIFWMWAKFNMGSALGKLDFQHASAQRIVDRMRMEAIRFSSQPHSDETATESESHSGEFDHYLPSSPNARACCLVSETIWQHCEKEIIVELVSKKLKTKKEFTAIHRLTLDHFSNPEALAEIISGDARSVAIVFESWMPPLEETKHLIVSARSHLEANTPIRILLAGKPRQGAAFSKPTSTEMDIWGLTISQLGDPYCMIDPLN